MSYTLTAIKHLVKDTPVISTDFVNVKTDHDEKPLGEATGEEEGEGLNQRMRDVLAGREKEGRHLFMHKALKKWLATPYKVCDIRTGLNGHMHMGVINAAIAENRLMDDLTSTVMQIPTMNKYKPEITHYFDLRGTSGLRKSLAKFLSQQLMVEPDEPLNPDLMTITNGAGPGLEMLVQILTEPGYAWMSPTPHCKQLEYNLTIRGDQPATIPIPLTSRIDGGANYPFELTMRKVKVAYKLAMQRGKKVAGIVLCNPHNPLGTIYSKELIKEILAFANEIGLHVIFDEVYALSMHEDVPFYSVASLKDLPNPMTTHFVWSCSKDLALSGFRCGVLYSWNPYVNKALGLLSQFTALPIPIQDKLQTYLTTQAKFLDEIFIPYNQIRLQRAKDNVIERLELMDIEVHPCDAGLFLWCYVGKHLKECSHSEELDLCEKMLLVGLWVVPGRLLDCVEPGWIRINFASKEEQWLEFFKRLPKALEKYHTNDDDDTTARFSPDVSDDEGDRDSLAEDQETWWNTESIMAMLNEAESEIHWTEAQYRCEELKNPPKDLQEDASTLPLTGSLDNQDRNLSKRAFNYSSLIIPSETISSVPQYVNTDLPNQGWTRLKTKDASKQITIPVSSNAKFTSPAEIAVSWGMLPVENPKPEESAGSPSLVVITGYEKDRGVKHSAPNTAMLSPSGPRGSGESSQSKASTNSRMTARKMARMRGAQMQQNTISAVDGRYNPNEDVAMGADYFDINKAFDEIAKAKV